MREIGNELDNSERTAEISPACQIAIAFLGLLAHEYVRGICTGRIAESVRQSQPHRRVETRGERRRRLERNAESFIGKMKAKHFHKGIRK